MNCKIGRCNIIRQWQNSIAWFERMMCSVDEHSQFDTSDWRVWISAMDGSKCDEHSEVMISSEAWVSGSCHNSYFDWNVLYMFQIR